jgi:enamine deaminase RidA (YjgF/YER057c/UK114 family)
VKSQVEPTAPVEHRVINPWTWQDTFGFVQAHEITGGGRTVFCAGQASVDEDGRPLHTGDIRAQLERTFDNLETVLKAADARLRDLVRLNYYTTDAEALLGAWDVIATRLAAADCRPASTLVGVQTLAFPELVVEIEATAVVDAQPDAAS